MQSKQSKDTLPVTVLSGFLEAVKTTVLNHVLHNQQGLRVALIVSDMSNGCIWIWRILETISCNAPRELLLGVGESVRERLAQKEQLNIYVHPEADEHEAHTQQHDAHDHHAYEHHHDDHFVRSFQ